jgi:integrase/recombinase XerC
VRRFSRQVGVPPIDATVDQHLTWFTSLTIDAASRAVELSHIKQYCIWAVRFGYRDEDPSRLLDSPRRKQRQPRPIAQARLDVALAAAERDPRLYAALTLAAYAGMRCCEIAVLRWDEVRETSLHIHGKGGTERLVPIHPRVRDALARLPRSGSEYVIHRLQGPPGPLCSQRIVRMLNQHLRACGVPDTAHACRHMFASSLFRHSKDIRLVQNLLGHASLASTMVYTAAWDDGYDAVAAI